MGKDNTAGEILQLVTFKVCDEEFSVDILKVQEIIRMSEITRVPNAPEFVEGVINLRGKVIPVIDLRKRFSLPYKERDDESRIIVVESDNRVVGLIVDGVSEVLRLPASSVEPPPDVLSSVNPEYIHGIGKIDTRLVILLDLERVLSKDEMAALGAMQT